MRLAFAWIVFLCTSASGAADGGLRLGVREKFHESGKSTDTTQHVIANKMADNLSDPPLVGRRKLCGELFGGRDRARALSECTCSKVFDEFEDVPVDLHNLLEPQESDLFKLPSTSGDGSSSTVIDFLFDELDSVSEDSGGGVMLPQVVRAETNNVADAGAAVGVCESLDIVNEDTFAFGFALPSGKELCAAFNPCTHLYAVSQEGILPPFTIAKVITVEAKALGFSLEKGLVHTSANEMWSGGDAGIMEFPGHFYLAGTSSMGIKVSQKVSAVIYMEAELMIDADPLGDGVFQPLGETAPNSATDTVAVDEDSKPPVNIDFALLATGTQSAEITLETKTKEYKVDLGGAVVAMKDLYIKVINDFVEVQYASGVEISLKGLCELSDALSPLCVIFNEDSGVTGRINAYFNTDGEFGLMLGVSAKFELNLGDQGEEIMEDLFGFDLSFEGSAEISMDFQDDYLELCLNLNDGVFDECLSFCNRDSDCPGDKFCNPILGMCRPKRDNGFWPCIKDSQCNSDRCVDLTRECKSKVKNGDACLTNKECGSGHCSNAICGKPCSEGCSSNEFCNSNYSPSFCRPKRNDGFSPCLWDAQCKSGQCSLALCGKPCSKGCSSNEFCNPNYSPSFCRPKQNNGFSPCLSDAQCYSGRCTDTTRTCKSKVNNGGACLANKECKSGYCSIGICGKPCSQGCSSSEFCNTKYSPDFCRPKQSNGFSPCIMDAQCYSGRCVDTTRKCAAKKGCRSSCAANKECQSGNCKWFKCKC